MAKASVAERAGIEKIGLVVFVFTSTVVCRRGHVTLIMCSRRRKWWFAAEEVVADLDCCN